MIKSLLISLLLTLLFELSLARLLGIRDREDLLLAGLVNGLTNPPLVLLLLCNRAFGLLPMGLLTLLLELSAFLLEGRVYKALLKSPFPPFRLALYLNLFSYSLGWLIQVF